MVAEPVVHAPKEPSPLSQPEDSDNILDTEPAPRALDSRQPSDDAFNFGTPTILPNRTANERDNDPVSAIVRMRMSL